MLAKHYDGIVGATGSLKKTNKKTPHRAFAQRKSKKEVQYMKQ